MIGTSTFILVTIKEMTSLSPVNNTWDDDSYSKRCLTRIINVAYADTSSRVGHFLFFMLVLYFLWSINAKFTSFLQLYV